MKSRRNSRPRKLPVEQHNFETSCMAAI